MRNPFCVVRERYLRQQELPLSKQIRRNLFAVLNFFAATLIVFCIATALSMMGVLPQIGIMQDDNEAAPSPDSNVQVINDTATELMDKWDCWMGGPPPADMQDKFPGGTIVLLRDQPEPVHTDDPVVIGAALDKALGEPSKNGNYVTNVFGFCRA